MKARGERGKGFLSGVSYLTISALLVKVIGLFYRIPMLSLLGTEGMGYFNTAYEVYAMACVVCTTGLPVAMSVLISQKDAVGDETISSSHAQSVFRTSLAVFWVIGLTGGLLLFGLSHTISALLKNQGAEAGIRMIAPTVLLICLSSAYRGYFQGRRYMAPTAISQVLEALGKLLLGVAFASYAVKAGRPLPQVAGYATLGLTVGTGISLIYLYVQKIMHDRHPDGRPDGRQSHRTVQPSLTKEEHLQHLQSLARIALPMTLSAMLMGGVKLLDLTLILHRLQAGGMTSVEATSAYGCYSTLALPIFNILPTLATSVSSSVVPSLASAIGAGEYDNARNMTRTALTMTLGVAIPASLGLAVFSQDILSLLFASQPHAVRAATPWLSLLALAIPASCLITVTGALLQTIGHATCPMISMIGGMLVKIVVSYFAISNPAVGMLGAPLGTVACDVVIVLLNLYFLSHHAPYILPSCRQSIKLFALPLLLAIVSVGIVLLMLRFFPVTISASLKTVITVLSVLCLYGFGWLLLWQRERTRAVSK